MMEQHVHQPAACILPSNAPNAHDQPYYGGTSSLGSRRALQERSGNRRDEPFDEVRLARAKALLKETEPQFIANVHQQKYKVVEVQDIPKIIRDSERLWNALWSCDDFRLYRQRQPKDLEVDTAPGQKSGRTWPDHMEASFCRGVVAVPSTKIRDSLIERSPCCVSADGSVQNHTRQGPQITRAERAHRALH